MPIFEFICNKCGARFEDLIPSSQQEVGCPVCGSADTQKQISPFSSITGSGERSCRDACPSGGG